MNTETPKSASRCTEQLHVGCSCATCNNSVRERNPWSKHERFLCGFRPRAWHDHFTGKPGHWCPKWEPLPSMATNASLTLAGKESDT
jgi:hypothetical protein